MQSHATIIGYTKPNAKPSKSNLLSNYVQITHDCSNTLPIKKLSRYNFKVKQHSQKQLNNFNTRCAEFSTKCRCSFISKTLLCIQLPLQSLTKIITLTSTNFYLPILSSLVHKIIPTIPTNTPFLFNSANFHFPIFAYSYLFNVNQKYFSTSVI